MSPEEGGYETWEEAEVARTLSPHDLGSDVRAPTLAEAPQAGAVRRLTPTECERLQSFPDGWTILLP
jgi:site-specific DNA-cytosine methylase